MPLVSEASAFNLRVELVSLARTCGGSLVSAFGRCFLKAHFQGLACMGELHVYWSLRLFFHCSVLFVTRRAQRKF